MPKKLLPSQQLEKHIETYLCQKIKGLGGIPYKFTSPSRRSVPDRMCVLPKGFVIFVECKRPGEVPTDAQYREIKRLAVLDQWVTWVDTKDKVDRLIKVWEERLNE